MDENILVMYELFRLPSIVWSFSNAITIPHGFLPLDTRKSYPQSSASFSCFCEYLALISDYVRVPS